ncbi:MAG TPA: hypothetical protein PL101_09570 [Bacteroidales bacterium]|nr:hypothetical protein [Bacteroidales bacterium]
MAASSKTHIFCLDDHRTFAEDLKKRFSDTTRYEVTVSHNEDDLLKLFSGEKSKKVCKIVIIGIHDSKDNYQVTDELISRIRTSNPETGILLVVSPERMEEASKQLRFNVDSFIPRNSNMVLRVHNAVKKHISEHNLKIYRKRRNISLLVFFIFLAFSLVVLFIARFKFPHYF